jgi:hypothetical protein
MDKVSSIFNERPSDAKNELAENIVMIAKDYIDDDDKYFPLGKFELLYLFLRKKTNNVKCSPIRHSLKICLSYRMGSF